MTETEPQRWRKRPVAIEAMHYDGTQASTRAVLDWIRSSGGEARPRSRTDLVIQTLEGEHRASPGDWIIKGVKGEFYPCKPDVFALTYEPVSTDTCARCAELARFEEAINRSARISAVWLRRLQHEHDAADCEQQQRTE